MADNNPIDDYRKSLDHVQNAERQVGKPIESIQPIGDRLNSWKQYSVSNVGVLFPSEVTYDRSRGSLNGNDWPSAKQMAETLSNWHTAWHAARNAYRRIPEDQRKVVQPLPER